MPESYSPDYLGEVGERFSEFIKAIGISRGQLAEELGYTEQMIGYYATGKHMPPVKVAVYLSKKYRLDLNYLYSGRGSVIRVNGDSHPAVDDSRYYMLMEKHLATMEQYMQCNKEREELQRQVEILTDENEKLRGQ